MKSNKKKTFCKIFFFYYKELGEKFLITILIFSLFVGFMFLPIITKKKTSNKNISFSIIFMLFFFISFVLHYIICFLVVERLTSSSLPIYFLFWRKIKKENNEDINLLTLTPNIRREDLIWAKFIVAYLYYLKLVALMVFYLIIISLYLGFEFIKMIKFSFFIFWIFSTCGYMFSVPIIFYCFEKSFFGNKILIFFYPILWICAFSVLSTTDNYFLNLLKNDFSVFLFPFIWMIYSLISGVVFFKLYKRLFLKKDIS